MRALRAMFVITIAIMCGLTFVWPFAVSADPSQPVFKLAAIATLVAFFTLLVALLVGRARDTPNRSR